MTPQLMLPVIPLGIDTDALNAQGREAEFRARWRTQLGIPERAIVFLFVGRLSFHAKANPLAMMIALEEAQRRTGEPVFLVQAGWFANEALREAAAEAASKVCPSVGYVTVDGRDPAVRCEIWHAADVFISLSDNIQETFGLAPLEAMAAGLPVIVSDWDGYRETVRNGLDGLTIPTLCPPPSAGEELAFRFENHIDNYDMYVGNVSLSISVDIAATSTACAALIADRSRRQELGRHGRLRAVQNYDWRQIIRRYQELWGELAQVRAHGNGGESAPRVRGKPWNPLRDDPFRTFDSYPTRAIEGGDLVRRVHGRHRADFEMLQGLLMFNYGLPSKEGIAARLLAHLVDLSVSDDAAPVTVDALVAALFPAPPRATCLRALGWLAKGGLVSIGAHNVT